MTSNLKFFTNTTTDNTCNAEHKMFINYCKTKTRQHSLGIRAAKGWNALSNTTKSAPSQIKFKELLDKDPKTLVKHYEFDN